MPRLRRLRQERGRFSVDESEPSFRVFVKFNPDVAGPFRADFDYDTLPTFFVGLWRLGKSLAFTGREKLY